MNYFQEDFTEKNYAHLIKLAKKNYAFKKFDDLESTDPYVLWRHDVDFSTHRALILAEIENKNNVEATYFILLNCEFYNIFEKEIKNIIKKIISLGHSIGVHFDPTAYKISGKKDLEKFLMFERKILEQLFDTDINAFSFHNPTPKILKFDDFTLAGMTNTYATIFKKEFGYCSDSNGYWRHDRLEDALHKAEFKKLQILTHPAWWQEEVMLPKERIKRCISGRANATEVFYDALLKEHKRENIG